MDSEQQTISIEANSTSILQFYAAAGVDSFYDEEPNNFFEQSKAKIKKAPQGLDKKAPPALKAQPAHIPDSEAIANANTIASSAKSLEELDTVLKQFTGCRLSQSARKTVFGKGNPNSDIMVIGIAPGREDDQQGAPFTGPDGQLLDKMLKAISLERENIFLANLIPWRPPGNRMPSDIEVQICLPFIKKQIDLVAPKIIICLGNIPTKVLLETNQNIMTMRGKWAEYTLSDGRAVSLMPTFHPNDLLRTPAQKKLSWADLLMIKSKAATVITQSE